MKANTIYTIGHSTHTMSTFLAMLKSFDIKILVDIRRFPSSRKFPHFNKEELEVAMEEAGIRYVHLVELGGRRKANKDSENTSWHNASFRGYADYMETPAFADAIEKLEHIALKDSTAYMCSEAVWWRCHRSMVSDSLKAKGWEVYHIMAPGKAPEHKYTAPAIVKDNKVVYKI